MAGIKSKFAAAQAIESPLILDLDGDGVETTAVDAGAWFDHATDGFAEQTGWVGKDDGLLARDLDGNGLIDTGRELFGSETLLADGSQAAHGFAALAELDANADGKVDSADAAFTTLRVWQDLDGDGYSADGELLTLAEAGVQSINVGYTNSTATDANGNQHKQVGSYTTTGGATRAAHDVWFATDPTYSIATDWVDVPDDIAALPDLTGYGQVFDLHQAMARDPGGVLQGLVTQFTQAADPAERQALAHRLLYAWTGAEPDASRSDYLDARQVVVLEGLLAQPFERGGNPVPPSAAAVLLRDAYTLLADTVYAQLMAQSHLKGLYDTIRFAWNDSTQSLEPDVTGLVAELQVRLAQDPARALADYGELTWGLNRLGGIAAEAAGRLAAEPTLAASAYAAAHGQRPDPQAGAGALIWQDAAGLTAYGGSGNDSLAGGAGNDVLEGGTGNDVLVGGAGDDILLGQDGHDDLDGGAGDDVLSGQGGGDVYRFGLGGGHDRIHEWDGYWSGSELRFGPGIVPEDLTVGRDGLDLLLAHVNGQDRVTIEDWYGALDRGYSLARVVFDDGQVWSWSQLQELGLSYSGSDNDDTIQGIVANHIFHYNERFSGLGGNDILNAGVGHDTLDGGSGEDTLNAGDGDDTLAGGPGNDALHGGAGADTYQFNLGDGVDTIHETQAGIYADTIVFGAGIAPGDVSLTRIADDLEFSHANGTDRLIVAGWFSPDAADRQIDRIRFADGSQWRGIDLPGWAHTFLGTAGDDDPVTGGESTEDLLLGLAGNDYLDGRGGDDVLDGGTGNDLLRGWTGTDIYRFDLGGGHDSIQEYDGYPSISVLKFGSGIRPQDLTVRREDLHLVLEHSNGEDSVTVLYWYADYSNWGYQLRQVEFDDDVGTIWDGKSLHTEGLTYRGTEWNDTITGIPLNYLFHYNEVFFGLEGDDTLQGSEGYDTLVGGEGDDMLDGGSGSDSMIGGTGNDIYQVDTGGDITGENSDEGTDSVFSAITWTVGVNIENLTLTGSAAINGTGSALNNILIGNIANNTLSGGDGNDSLLGMGGDDLMSGGKDNDTLDGGAGNDNLNGSFGDDTLYGGAGIDTVQGGDDNDQMYGGADQDILNGQNGDDVGYGESGDDVLQGEEGNDLLDGGDGKDTLMGDAGRDILTGGDGNDLMDGGSGNDNMSGDEGNDNMNGGYGSDNMNGGYGDDTLTGASGKDTLAGGGGNDNLDGGLGNDLYLFNRGDGADLWLDTDTTAGNLDIARFGLDVAYDQIWFRQLGNDLETSLIGTGDRALIKDWYTGQSRHLERFESGSGQILLDSQVQALVDAMAGFAPPAAGQTTLPDHYRQALELVLAANWR